jgi:hypothetical protein
MLAKEWGCPDIDPSKMSDSFVAILENLDHGARLKGDEVTWLQKNQRWSVLESAAAAFQMRYLDGDISAASTACSLWGDAGKPIVGVELLSPEIETVLSQNAFALSSYARCLVDMDRADLALRYANEAIRIDTDEGRSTALGYCLLARIYRKLGGNQQAQEKEAIAGIECSSQKLRRSRMTTAENLRAKQFATQ